MQRKKIIVFVLASLLCPLGFLSADGGFIPRDYTQEDVYEPSQTALMVYKDGQEDIYLRVNYQGNASDFVWIVPTPSFPKAVSASAEIFKELSALTTSASRNKSYDLGFQAGYGATEAVDVIVHSQQTVGIYEVTVLSARGADGIFDWLVRNGYKVKPEVKEVLDWYVQKEWYFTAMRIDPEAKTKKGLAAFSKLDSSANKENFAEKLSQYAIKAVRVKNYQAFMQAAVIAAEFDEEIKLALEQYVNTEEKFLNYLNNSDLTKYTDADWQEAEESITNMIKKEISQSQGEGLDKYNDYIEPIKISFQSPVLVYPLKISQISTKVPLDPKQSLRSNEVLLYVIADERVMAPGFGNEYAQTITATSLSAAESRLYRQKLSSLREIVGDSSYVLSKIRRKFAKAEMDEDLYLVSFDGEAEKADGLAEDRDKRRISDIKMIQTALELYYNDHDRYISAISFGAEFYNDDKTGLYMASVPTNPEPGGMAYEYKVLKNGQDYDLRFRLEEGIAAYGGGGLCLANTSGIKCTQEVAVALSPLSSAYAQNNAYSNIQLKKKGSALSDRLKGKILIKVEDKGKAYYVNPANKYSYYLGRPNDAFKVMREQGVGIRNQDLAAIPLGLTSLAGPDSDQDGLPDLFEDAVGTDKNKKDSDKDGYSDKQELENGFNPLASGALKINKEFSAQQKGKIFLQVEGAGEAWYVNPADGKRYFLGRPDDAFRVMRNLGTGISNADFSNL